MNFISIKDQNKFLPLVSVIIPFYKHKDWLLEALESVKNQKYSNLEVIIINDGSEVNIDLIKESFLEYKFIDIPNGGAGAARNLGIERASGDYIAFLDSDDIWEPNKIHKQLNYMLAHGSIWSHTNYQKFYEEEPNRIDTVNTKLSGNIIPTMFITCPIATPCVMVKREVFINDKSIRFSTVYQAGEDSYLWFRLAEKYELAHLDLYSTKVRIRGSNAAYNAKLQLEAKAQNYKFLTSSKYLFKRKCDYIVVIIGFF
ncbi:glycosyltransferase family 2 protein [Sphingobacterium sp. IITKGP-BTPF85]|uniref:glycosyltransferase family 2 protein n=1 Tax=Sphingobacterium sp. IITKGP-BTPF85 TaxID=1338009 RepID=UPI00038A2386|nr:glycosyltransferase family A protein [Sphingobacterium sp. IITKGP-BTPF85]KKX51748.1 hypothetical protein L950_0203835 [Sphingobacterium sp. IITKGP-BTPF85]